MERLQYEEKLEQEEREEKQKEHENKKKYHEMKRQRQLNDDVSVTDIFDSKKDEDYQPSSDFTNI